MRTSKWREFAKFGKFLTCPRMEKDTQENTVMLVDVYLPSTSFTKLLCGCDIRL